MEAWVAIAEKIKKEEANMVKTSIDMEILGKRERSKRKIVNAGH